MLSVASLLAFAIGFGLGYVFYIGRFADPVKFVNSNIFFYAIHKFFLNRWYLNALIYWTFVVAPLYIARGLYKYFENFVLRIQRSSRKNYGWRCKNNASYTNRSFTIVSLHLWSGHTHSNIPIVDLGDKT